MKKKLVLAFCSIIILTVSATLSNAQVVGSSTIPLTVVAAKQQHLPETVVGYLNDKLMQVISRNGLGTADYNSRFAITASVVPVTKDIIQGPPKQIAESLDLTFYIVDNVDHKIFSSVTAAVKAVEASEEKVLIKAIRSVDAGSQKISAFVNMGRDRIIAYYDSQCDNIIAKAEAMASRHQYEAALFELYMVPECCPSAFAKCSNVAEKIYSSYVDYWGEVCLAKAKALWTAEQNAEGARKAGEYLCQILPESRSYSKAEKLYQEMANKVKADIDFEMRKYDDSVDVEKARINAWKEVGIAYGKGQQPVDTNITWLLK